MSAEEAAQETGSDQSAHRKRVEFFDECLFDSTQCVLKLNHTEIFYIFYK